MQQHRAVNGRIEMRDAPRPHVDQIGMLVQQYFERRQVA